MVFDTLFNAYPQGDVTLQDFVTALTPGAPNFILTLTTVLITFVLGFQSIFILSCWWIEKKVVLIHYGCTLFIVQQILWESGCFQQPIKLSPFLVLSIRRNW